MSEDNSSAKYKEEDVSPSPAWPLYFSVIRENLSATIKALDSAERILEWVEF